jgi:hypothetical protein
MHPPLIIELTSSTNFGLGFYIRSCYIARTPRGRSFIVSIILDEDQRAVFAGVQFREVMCISVSKYALLSFPPTKTTVLFSYLWQYFSLFLHLSYLEIQTFL